MDRPIDRSPRWHSSTISALNSAVNERRRRGFFPMLSIVGHPSGREPLMMAVKAGQVHSSFASSVASSPGAGRTCRIHSKESAITRSDPPGPPMAVLGPATGAPTSHAGYTLLVYHNRPPPASEHVGIRADINELSPFHREFASTASQPASARISYRVLTARRIRCPRGRQARSTRLPSRPGRC
jgi:hypothetical protein